MGTAGKAYDRAVRYMVVERFLEGARPVYERAKAHGRMLPPGLVYVDSWIDDRLYGAFQLMETEDPRLLEQWVEAWGDLVAFEIVPVIGSTEAAVRAFASHGASGLEGGPGLPSVS